MHKLFIGVMLIASMSNVGCTSCDKNSQQAKANACLSDPACVNQVRIMAGNMPDGILNVQKQVNANPALYAGQAPPILPMPGANGAIQSKTKTQSVSNSDIQSHHQQVVAALQKADSQDIVANVVPQQNAADVAAAHGGLLTQQDQVNGRAADDVNSGGGGMR